jgi:hypothetical protein
MDCFAAEIVTAGISRLLQSRAQRSTCRHEGNNFLIGEVVEVGQESKVPSMTVDLHTWSAAVRGPSDLTTTRCSGRARAPQHEQKNAIAAKTAARSFVLATAPEPTYVTTEAN